MNTLGTYANIVIKRLWLIALLVVVTVVGIYYVDTSRPPNYQATVRLQVLVTEPENVAIFATVRQTVNDEQKLRTGVEFIDVLRNRKVAWEAARAINKELGTSITADDILEAMWPRIEGTTVVVTYRNVPTATLAKRMADVHIEKALAFYRTMRTRSVTAARVFIEQQVEQQQATLSQARARLRDFQLKYNLSDVNRESTAVQDQIRSLRLERDRAQLQADQALASARIYRQQAKRLREEAATVREEDPEQADTLLAQAREYEAKALAQEAVAAGQQAMVARYERLTTAYENRLAELIGLQGEYERLVTEVKLAEDRYAFLADKLSEARIKEEQALSSGYLQVIEAAREPVQPAPRQTVRFVLFGAFLALLLGVVLAFALEFFGNLVGRPATAPHPQRETP